MFSVTSETFKMQTPTMTKFFCLIYTCVYLLHNTKNYFSCKFSLDKAYPNTADIMAITSVAGAPLDGMYIKYFPSLPSC